jgi:hypothetical protein
MFEKPNQPGNLFVDKAGGELSGITLLSLPGSVN